MNRLSFHHRDHAWAQRASVDLHRFYLKGTAYIDNQAVSPATVATAVTAAQSPDKLTSLLQRMNGFYAWVEETAEGVRAAVDHIRSCPLFYAVSNGDLFLSDDAEWIRQQVGEDEMNLIAREEFLLTGYVTGSDTLFPTIKQLQAGEYLLAAQSETGIKISTHRFYRFLHTEPMQFDEVKGFEALDQVALRSVQRLIDHANGRLIVVPLSGGYDSRLIVSLLKRLNYRNILTFSYGTPGNKESEYSKQVADALGLRWHFVEYSEKLWREAWQTTERWEYQKMAAGWSSLAHVQDWLAVKIMKNQGLLAEDCIFVPGHTGDFISGGHIPDGAQKGVEASTKDLSEAILLRHYALAPLAVTSSRSVTFWQARMLERAEASQVTDGVSLANAFEKWEWQERQAKFICNSVRVYDFFGYDWWLPLWDYEFTTFWQDVPLDLRRNRNWYLKYVTNVYAAQAVNVSSSDLGNASDGGLLAKRFKNSAIYGAMKKMNIFPIAKKAIIFLRISRTTGSLSGIFPELELSTAEKNGIQINGLFAKSFIESVKPAGFSLR